MEMLTGLIGNPHTAYRVIHIAGSKGKGSTAYLLAHSFAAHGYRTGCYLSPHVHDYRERFVLLPNAPQESQWTAIANEIHETVLHHCGDASQPKHHPVLGLLPPTTFEILTLFAFMLFRAAKCEWAMIECGLGGRYDSTNVVRPAGTIITSIEREHTQYLGRTLRRIASQKAGIIKRDTPLFLFPQRRRVARVAERRAATMSAPVHHIPVRMTAFAADSAGPAVPADSAILPMQHTNIAAAYLVSAHYIPRFSPSRFQSIIPRAQLIGRYQRIRRTPPIYCDGAHTRLSLAAAVRIFTATHGRHGVCVFGCGKDKNSRRLLRVVRGKFAHYIFTAQTEPHTMTSPALLRRRAIWLGFPRRACTVMHGIDQAAASIDRAAATDDRAAANIVETIIKQNQPVLICGSFYIIAPIQRALSAIY